MSFLAYAGESSRTLEDAFGAALKRSDVVAGQTELITQAEEHYAQATGAVLPSLVGAASYLWQNQPNGLAPNPLVPWNQPLVKLTATQPLFRGFREISGIKQTQDLTAAQVFAKRQAELQLYRDVAQSFFTVLQLEQDLRDLRTEIGYDQKRVADLNERRKIGRSRLSEVLSVESTMATLKAQASQTEGQISIQREVLAFLTGYEKGVSLQDPVVRTEQAPAVSLEPLTEFLAAIDQRPDVRADMERAKGADQGIWIAKGAHLPSVDLTADYYGIRTGYLADSRWDVQLLFTVPLYVGGVISSKAREAESQLRQADDSLSQTKRNADEEIRTLYAGVVSDFDQVRALVEATALSERSYTEQSHEYRLGLVTNLDVLQALTTFQESQRALDRARYSLRLDQTKLEIATNRRAVP